MYLKIRHLSGASTAALLAPVQGTLLTNPQHGGYALPPERTMFAALSQMGGAATPDDLEVLPRDRKHRSNDQSAQRRSSEFLPPDHSRG